VLRNGQVLAGQITRAGDFYIVTLGATGEVRLPVADVEFECSSLDEAYVQKRDNIFPRGVKGHLDLAEWCLRHRLLSASAEQLVAAMKLEPNHPRIAELDRRITLAAESPAEAIARSGTSTAMVSAEQMEQRLRELPPLSVEKFSAVVQPILLNRCGANQCHGPNSKAEFRLLKPPPGQNANRRFTQRNLYAALELIDQSQPQASPILTMPQRRHGSALAAIFDKHSQKQLDELASWVGQTLVQSKSVVPATIPTGDQPTLLQAGPREPAAGTQASGEHPAASGDTTVKAMRPQVDDLTATPKANTGERFVPRDEFDPEIFNRRFSSKR
jgi:hypothetical protein